MVLCGLFCAYVISLYFSSSLLHTISDKIQDQARPVLCRSFTALPISHSLSLYLSLHHLLGTPCFASDWLPSFQPPIGLPTSGTAAHSWTVH